MTAAPHCFNRKNEWTLSIVLALMGLSIFIAPFIGYQANLAAAAFGNLGIPTDVTGFVFMAVGWVSCVALYANGHWPIGPQVRATGCAIRMMIWMQLAYGALLVSVHLKMVLFVMIVWTVFTFIDGWQFLRALTDVRIYEAKRKAALRALGNARGAT